MKLVNRNVIVTGGSQGLGRTIVEIFVREGANVLLCARDERAAAALATAVQAQAPLADQRVLAQGCDVSSVEDVETLFAAADDGFDGPLHVLVNNAGIYGPKGPTDEVDFEEWKRCVDINLYGTLLPCRAAMKRFKASGYGKIVNLSGGGATNPMPNLSAYAASKAAVVRLTETLALELVPYRVDVNAVAPGALNTRLLEEVLAAGPEKVGEKFYQQSQTAGGGRRRTAGTGRGAVRVPREQRKRRRHGQAHQCQVGPVEAAARVPRRVERQRHLRAAPDHAGGPGEELAAVKTKDALREKAVFTHAVRFKAADRQGVSGCRAGASPAGSGRLRDDGRRSARPTTGRSPN